ncbi:uncharacterized protein BDZ99DRAFT_513064 [Mytilinidion resinicola]|uniref:Uncharacterized protein n=1 Tax=Mytilinidion resinicola TaxID=574789 RepID=A0A6A6Z6Y0_9PEZI|nr:uncharacterized protein BDZ99DRAFT_513064 [Mytilinidion resinicola]KAF2816790.1 hypothetical protein BDZ99DRAFT_513064 [Mytilinidion resinicola]
MRHAGGTLSSSPEQRQPTNRLSSPAQHHSLPPPAAHTRPTSAQPTTVSFLAGRPEAESAPSASPSGRAKSKFPLFWNPRSPRRQTRETQPRPALRQLLRLRRVSAGSPDVKPCCGDGESVSGPL